MLFLLLENNKSHFFFLLITKWLATAFFFSIFFKYFDCSNSQKCAVCSVLAGLYTKKMIQAKINVSVACEII